MDVAIDALGAQATFEARPDLLIGNALWIFAELAHGAACARSCHRDDEPARVNGRRIYDLDAIRRIDVLRFAQQAGFTLEEIKTLFNGFGSDTPLSARWQTLVRPKLAELVVLATRIQRMRRAFEVGLKCGCVRIEDCSLSPADVPEPKRQRAKASKGCGC